MKHLLVISSNIENIEKTRKFLDEFFKDYHLDSRLFNRVFLGLSEAVINSILHGNRKVEEKKVHIGVEYVDGFLNLEVEDEGNGFEFDAIESPVVRKNRSREWGRGIFLIRSFADQVIYSKGGRNVFIRYAIDHEY